MLRAHARRICVPHRRMQCPTHVRDAYARTNERTNEEAWLMHTRNLSRRYARATHREDPQDGDGETP